MVRSLRPAVGVDESAWFWLLLAWSLAWKGPALWRAARLGQVAWFAAMFILQTAGILEMLYLFVVSKSRRIAA